MRRTPIIHTLRSDGTYTTAALLAADTGATPTFARNCTAYRDYWDGATRKLAEVAANIPRWVTRKDTGGVARSGLLVEPDRTNVCKKGSTIGEWTIDSGHGSLSTAAASPFPTTNAYGVVQTAITDYFRLNAPAQDKETVGAVYILSAFAKAGCDTWAILHNGRLPVSTAWFNLSNGAVGTKTAAVTAAGTESYGGGWYRIWTKFVGVDAAPLLYLYSSTGDNVANIVGQNGQVGTYFCNVQLEVATNGLLSSPIDVPSTSPVTRLGSALSYNVTGRIGQRGSLVFSFQAAAIDLGVNVVPVSLHDGSANNRITCSILATGDKASATVVSGGDTQADITDATTDVVDGDKHTIAISWEPNSIKLYVDGTLEGTADTEATIPSGITTLTLGDHDGANQPNAMISDLKIYNRPGVTS